METLVHDLDYQQHKDVMQSSRKDKPSKREHPIKVTKNGEVSWCTIIEQYIVYDETYCFEVARTSYPLVALSALSVYCRTYLGEG